ncbi:MAG: D-alanine--D-alanine ligase [Gemmatimonadota bacterium]|nr:D-alanine--D-alanine ligase [Gemmatimonadota bacterium]
MTRIGFAYNQKPESTPATTAADADDEPPSTRRDHDSRTFDSPPSTSFAARGGGTGLVAPPVPTLSDVYAEWDSVETIDAVARALSAFGEIVRLEATADFPQRLRDARVDLVFNIAEGLYGPNREAHVPAICEFFGIPYSGSDPFTLSLCLHKARTKQMLAAHGVPTPAFVLLETDAALEALAAGRHAEGPAAAPEFPLFLKPVQEGSSKGITERNFVRDARELLARGRELLRDYAQPVLAEAYLPGAEFTCGVLGNGPQARVLPPVAMHFETLPAGAVPVYGFEAKWVWDTRERPLEIFECPARVPAELLAAIEDVTLRAYHAVGCRDWARIDVRLDAAGAPHVIEINPLPGILPDPADNSCLPKAARAAGLSYDALIQRCLVHAAERQGVPLQRRSAE